MYNVIPESEFKRRLMQKEFNTLYARYVSKGHCIFMCGSLANIFSENKVKIVEYYCNALGYIDNCTIPTENFIQTVTYMEWDHEWVKDDVLRISITSSYWYDIYFSVPLDVQAMDIYYESMEDDVLKNYAIMDEYVLDSEILGRRITDLQDEYYTLFGDELVPSFL